MVPALYLNIYNLQMLPLILSFILLMCFICLNSYLAFPAIKQQGLWPVFHSSHADPIDLTLICRIFSLHMNKCKHAKRQHSLLLLHLKTFTMTVWWDTRPSQLPKGAEQGPSMSGTASQTPAALGTVVTQPQEYTAVSMQGRCSSASFKHLPAGSLCLLGVLTSKIICRYKWQLATLYVPC